MSNTW